MRFRDWNIDSVPDGIVYVNGLPLVVLEFKSAIKENTTIEDAYKQLTIRYRRDIPELFKYNAFVVISDGVNNKIGSLFYPYEYFYAWRKVESTDKEASGISSLITMVKGLFRKDRLVKVIKDFVYFTDSSDKETKIVCRYHQFFAAESLYKSTGSAIRPKGNGKGGIYFGATDCGKSYTMVFLSRLLMKSRELNSPTIVVITDRTDLDAQLSKIFIESKNYIGDDKEEFEDTDKAVVIVKDQISVLDAMFNEFDSSDYYNGTPLQQLQCLNEAVEFVQHTEDLEKHFMEAVRRMKRTFNLCASRERLSKSEKDTIGFYVAVRSILFKLTKGDAPDITTMNHHVAQLINEAIKAD